MSDLYRSGSRGTPHSAMSRSSSSNPFRSSQRENLPSFRECFEGFDERRLAHLGETVLMVAQSPQQWRGGGSSSASALSASSSPAPGSPHYRMHSAANSGGTTTRRDPLPHHHHHPSTSGGSFSPIGGGGGGGGLSLLSPLQPSPRRLGTEAQRSAPLSMSSSQDPQSGTGGGRAGGGGTTSTMTMQQHGGGGTAADFSTTSLPLSEEEDENDGGLGMSGGEPHNERDYHHLGSRAPPQTPPRRIERESDESLLPTPIPRSDGGVGGHHPLLPPLHPTQYNHYHSSGAGGLSPPPWGPSMYLGEEDGTATGSSSPPSTSPHRHREEKDSAAAAAGGSRGASIPSGKQKKSGTLKTGRSSRGEEEMQQQQQQREEADALGRLLKLFESGSHPPSSASEEGAPIAQQQHPSTAVVAVQKDDLALLVRQLLRLTATAPPRASLPMHSHPQEGGPQGQRSKPPRTVLDADDDAGCWAPLHETSDPFVSSSSCVPVRVQVDRLIPSWQSSLPTTTTSAFQVAYRRRDFAYYQPDFDAWSRPPVTRTVLHPLY